MKILSIDVGIKNLALCVLETTNSNTYTDEKSDNLKAYYFCMLYSFHTKCSSFSAPVNNSNFIS